MMTKSAYQLVQELVAEPSREAADVLVELRLGNAKQHQSFQSFMAALPGLAGRLTTDVFDYLADAYDAWSAEWQASQIRGLPEAPTNKEHA